MLHKAPWCAPGRRREVATALGLAPRPPPRVGGDIIHAVGTSVPDLPGDEILTRDVLGRARGMPRAPGVLEVPDSHFLLGIHGDHGPASPWPCRRLGRDVPELGVPVGVLVAFAPLARGREAIPLGSAPAMLLRRQRPGQGLGTPGRPPYGHGVAPGDGVHQLVQIRAEPGVGIYAPPAAASQTRRPRIMGA